MSMLKVVFINMITKTSIYLNKISGNWPQTIKKATAHFDTSFSEWTEIM